MSNSGHVVGNLTAKPELRYTPAGKAYTSFTVASGQRKFNQAENRWEDGLTDFIRCVAFGHEAEGVANLEKGNRVLAFGDWRPTEYKDREGVQRKDREFVISEIGASVRFQSVTAQRSTSGGGGRPPAQQAPQNSYNQEAPMGDGFDEQPF